jgi:hypothetical protein
LRFVAVGEDRIHHQRRLDAHHRSVAGIDPLHFARHQAVGDVISARAAVFFRQGHAQQPERAHLTEYFGLDRFLLVGFDDAGQQPVLSVGLRGVADLPFVVGQLPLKAERVVPIERSSVGIHGRRVLSGAKR